jgi:hypothetical protein
MKQTFVSQSISLLRRLAGGQLPRGSVLVRPVSRAELRQVVGGVSAPANPTPDSPRGGWIV